MFLDSNTLTLILKSLESKGYAVCARSKEDERVLEVEITEKGEGLKEQAVSSGNSAPTGPPSGRKSAMPGCFCH